jgi:hypothetical protein
VFDLPDPVLEPGHRRAKLLLSPVPGHTLLRFVFSKPASSELPESPLMYHGGSFDGWARLLDENQTKNRLGQALLLLGNQTSGLVHWQPGRGWPGPSSLSMLCTTLISITP